VFVEHGKMRGPFTEKGFHDSNEEVDLLLDKTESNNNHVYNVTGNAVVNTSNRG